MKIALLRSPVTPLQADVDNYMLFKRRRLSSESERGYTATLREFVNYFPGHTLADFEPPKGTHLIEDFLGAKWGDRSGRTFNKNLSTMRDFFRWQVVREKMQRDPMLPIEKAKVQQVHRQTFSDDQRARILAVNPAPRDQIALRLLLDYGVRKGGLLSVRYGSFDRKKQRVEVFTKGQKYHYIPIPDDRVWQLLEQLDRPPLNYLMCRQVRRRRRPPEKATLARIATLIDEATTLADASTDPASRHELGWTALTLSNAAEWLDLAAHAASFQTIEEFPDEQMGTHPMHDLWYLWLARAGIVPFGVTRGQRMHQARHSAGQRVLERTGNLKAAQALLGHANISTTGNVYVDWDEVRLHATMAGVVPAADMNDELVRRAGAVGTRSRT